MQIVTDALLRSGLAPRRLELEITENVFLQNSEMTRDTLYKLRALGVRIALDDFGTGYSSLSYLLSFPFDKIKIDRSFIIDIATSTRSQKIVKAVVALAGDLDMETTAEGIRDRGAARSGAQGRLQGASRLPARTSEAGERHRRDCCRAPPKKRRPRTSDLRARRAKRQANPHSAALASCREPRPLTGLNQFGHAEPRMMLQKFIRL